MPRRLCPHCRYNLSGTPDVDGRRRCPECGEWYALPTPEQSRLWERRWQVPLLVLGIGVVVSAGLAIVDPDPREAEWLGKVLLATTIASWIWTSLAWVRSDPRHWAGARSKACILTGGLAGLGVAVLTAVVMLFATSGIIFFASVMRSSMR